MAFFAPTALDSQSPVFRGRAAELEYLIRLCQDEVGSYVVLYGGRQNGKTSLLLRLESALRARVNVCRIDFQLIKGASPERTFAFLATQIARIAPFAPDPNRVQDGPTLQDFLHQTLIRPDLGRLVLLLDELGALPAATREVLAHALRSLFHARLVLPALKKLQILFSGGIELYNLVLTEASSLYNICEEVYLADLSRPEATELIADGLRQLGLPSEPASALGDAVYARAAGHPYLTQRLGALLERAYHTGRALDAAALGEAEHMLCNGDSLVRRIRDDLHEHGLEAAARRLLSDPPRFTRLDDDMTRLELIGLAKPNGERWAPRNPLLADLFRERLGLPPLPAAPVALEEPRVTPIPVQPPASPTSALLDSLLDTHTTPPPARTDQKPFTPLQHEPPVDRDEPARAQNPRPAAVRTQPATLRRSWFVVAGVLLAIVTLGVLVTRGGIGTQLPRSTPTQAVVSPTLAPTTSAASITAAPAATLAPTTSIAPTTAAPTPTTSVAPTTAAPAATLAPTTAPLPAWVPKLVQVPGGDFLMGSNDSDSLADPNEKPQHTLNLPTYWIGKTEVTNAQFRPFVEGDGYTNQAYWTKAGWEWRQSEKITKPLYWDDSQWNGDNQPVVGVSWYEAVAYCRWLSAQTGREFRLPSEAEWEKAARGADGRIWPWGNTWADGRANSKEAGLGKTTPVGQYLDGAGPYGALDMAGNVWEWCATRLGKSYPYQIEDEWQAAYLAANDNPVLRGGGWTSEQKPVRAPYRGNFNYPRDRYKFFGLRVASHSRSGSDS